MRIHLPGAAAVAALGCLAMGGCTTSYHDTGTGSCPNLGPVAQQYMQGSDAMPVRCEPQKVNYWDPTVTTTGADTTK